MMESVSVEMCVSVIELPPISVAVVDVNSPVISCCLMNEVMPMTNSRNALSDPPPLEVLDDALDADQPVLQAGGLGVFADDPEQSLPLHPLEVDPPADGV